MQHVYTFQSENFYFLSRVLAFSPFSKKESFFYKLSFLEKFWVAFSPFFKKLKREYFYNKMAVFLVVGPNLQILYVYELN